MPEMSTYNILQATNNPKPFILWISLQKPQKLSKNNHINTKFLWFLQSQNHIYEKELWQYQLLSVICQVFSREGSGTAALMRTAEFTLFNDAALPKPCRHFPACARDSTAPPAPLLKMLSMKHLPSSQLKSWCAVI